MFCEFDAEMHLDAQNLKQCYQVSALQFLLIAHTHLTTSLGINTYGGIKMLIPWQV